MSTDAAAAQFVDSTRSAPINGVFIGPDGLMPANDFAGLEPAFPFKHVADDASRASDPPKIGIDENARSTVTRKAAAIESFDPIEIMIPA